MSDLPVPAELDLSKISTDEIDAQLARKRHLDFMKFLWQRSDPFVIGLHTREISSRIDKAFVDYTNGISTYLMIEIPFRHGKSEILSRYLPPNFLAKFPDQEVIVASYSASLAETFSRTARQIMRSDRYRMVAPGVKISEGDESLSSWGIDTYHTETKSWRPSMGRTHWVGLDGAITGKGCSLLCLDDPFSGREEAESEVMRQKRWESVRDNLLTRLAPVSIAIFLATPWHVDDIFGRIKKEMADNPGFPKFIELKFPAKSDKYPTGYLFSERFSNEWYEMQFATLGPYAASALLQCEPILREGGQIKVDKIHYVDSCPDDIRYTIGWDLASSEKQRNKEDPDYTVGIKLGVQWLPSAIPGKPTPVLYIDDMWRGRWEGLQRDKIIQDVAMANPAITVGIEAFGGYKDAYTSISTILRGIRIVKKLQLPGDKQTKADLITPAFEAGNVYIRKAPWNQELLEELAAFPGGRHDDCVDSLVVSFATHSPNTTQVWNTPTSKEVSVNDFEVRIDKLSPFSTPIISEWVEDNMRTSILFGLWNAQKGKLWIFREIEALSPTPQIIVPMINKYIHFVSRGTMTTAEKWSWFGSEIMFAGKKGMSDLQNAYRRESVNIRNHRSYEEYGAIQLVQRLSLLDRITIHSDCEEFVRQYMDWFVDRNRPADGFGMCRSLCLMVACLYEYGLISQSEKPMKPYSKESRDFHQAVDKLSAAGKLDSLTDDEFKALIDPGSDGGRHGWM